MKVKSTFPFSFKVNFNEAAIPSSTGLADTKVNAKDLCVTTTTTSSTLGPPNFTAGNHLDIPTGNNNPNLLSPDVMNQRRGELTFKV